MKNLYYIYYIAIFVSVLLVGCDGLFGPIANVEEQNAAFKSYGTSENEQGIYMAKVPSGGYILGGHTFLSGETQDYFVVKTDDNGQVQWSKIFGNKNENDVLHKITPDGNNGFYLLGDTVLNFGSARLTVPIIIQISADGAYKSSMKMNNFFSEIAVDMSLLPDGKIALLSNTENETARLSLIDFTADSVIWDRTYAYENVGLTVTSLNLLSDGHFTIGGVVASGNGNQLLILEVDERGGELNVNFMENGWEVKDLEPQEDGSYLVLADKCLSCFDGVRIYKVSSDLLTANVLHEEAGMLASYIQKIDGTYLATGLKSTTESVGGVEITTRMMVLMKLNADGTHSWTQEIDISNRIPASRTRTFIGNMVGTTTGGYALIGTHDFITHTKMILMQTDTDGNL